MPTLAMYVRNPHSSVSMDLLLISVLTTSMPRTLRKRSKGFENGSTRSSDMLECPIPRKALQLL
jgi:hypothetical protein